ncbi:MAG: branched-chain amino acid ABC transporter permease [Planctomycetota bacterium]|jgi:branched-subunit amino acid ABC-type transport system permease component
MDFWSYLASTLLLGIQEAAPLVLAAIGFTLIFRLNGFINVAFSESITIGAFIGVTLNLLGWNAYVSMIPSAIAGGILSVISYLAFYRPALRRGVGKGEMIILSVGVSYLFRHLIKIVWGNETMFYSVPGIQPIKIFGVGVTNLNLVCIGLVIITAVAITLFMYRTRYGEKMRALADNEDLAKSSGVNPLVTSTLIWAIAGVAAGVAGAFIGIRLKVSADLGWNQILFIIMITIVGGIGSVRGAIVAAFSVGIIQMGLALPTNSYYASIALLVLFVVALKFRKEKV